MKRALALVITGLMVAAAAPQPVELKSEVQLERTVTEGGATRVELVRPDVVVPGDHLLFTTAYHNVGTAPVDHFVVTNPVPDAIALTAEAAATLEVSVDGGKTWGALAGLTVAGTEGKARPALPDDITHVRWTIARLVPGAQGVLTYHANVR